MKQNRWLNGIVVVVLLALAAMTARQLAATAQVVSANAGQTAVSQTEHVQNPFDCPFTPEQIRSIHLQTIQGLGHSILYTGDGPTGVEGGLNMLRYCSIP